MASVNTSDGCDAIWNRDAGQVGAVFERLVSDAGDAVGDCDAGQAGAKIESILSDAGDKQAVGGAGDDHRAAGTGVLVDVKRTVVIGRENKLSLHHGGQHRRTHQPDLNQVLFGLRDFRFPFIGQL